MRKLKRENLVGIGITTICIYCPLKNSNGSPAVLISRGPGNTRMSN